jgi:hypothetical protein
MQIRISVPWPLFWWPPVLGATACAAEAPRVALASWTHRSAAAQGTPRTWNGFATLIL